MNLLGRFEIFSSPLGSESVEGLDQICLEYGTPVPPCVCDTVLCQSLHIHVHWHLENTLIHYVSFSKDT